MSRHDVKGSIGRVASLICVVNTVVIFAGLLFLTEAELSASPEAATVEIPVEFVPTRDDLSGPLCVDSDDATPEDCLTESSADSTVHPLQETASRAFAEQRVEEAITLVGIAIKELPDEPVLHNALGVYQLAIDQVAAAQASFKRATDLDPSFHKAHYNLGTMLLKRDDAKQALHHLEESVRLQSHYEKARYNLAQAHARLGNTDRAIAEYRTLSQLNDGAEYAKASYNMGLLLMREKHVRQAIDAFRLTLRRKPDYIKARYNLALLLSRLDLRDEARREYEKILLVSPDHFRSCINLGVMMMREGEWSTAVTHLERAIVVAPENPRAHYNLGLCSLQLKQSSRAASAFRAALVIDPDYAQAHSKLGLTFRRDGRLEEARQAYRRALELLPDRADYAYKLARVQSKLGDVEGAIECYQRTLALDPESYRGWYHLGTAEYRRGEYAESASALSQATRLRPHSYEAAYHLGRARLKTGHPELAEQAFRTALTVDSTASVHYHLGIALERQGKQDPALVCHLQTIRIDPKHALALKHGAVLLTERNAYVRAIRMLRRVQQLNADDATAYNLGLGLFDAKRYETAEVYFQVAVKAGASLRVKALNMRGLALARLERLEEAIAMFEQGLELAPEDSTLKTNLEIMARRRQQLGLETASAMRAASSRR